MTRYRKLKNPRHVLVSVESDVYDELMSHFSRDVYFADKVREWMAKELESLRIEKNEQAQIDPLNLSRKHVVFAKSDNTNRKLDLYQVSELEAVQHVCNLIEISDWDTILMLNPKVLKMHRHCVRAIQKKNAMTPEKIEMLKSFERKREMMEQYVPMGLD